VRLSLRPRRRPPLTSTSDVSQVVEEEEKDASDAQPSFTFDASTQLELLQKSTEETEGVEVRKEACGGLSRRRDWGWLRCLTRIDSLTRDCGYRLENSEGFVR